jgi:hypothetical protein
MASRLSMLQKDAQLAVENKLSSATTLSWSFQRFCNISLMLKLKRSRQASRIQAVHLRWWVQEVHLHLFQRLGIPTPPSAAAKSFRVSRVGPAHSSISNVVLGMAASTRPPPMFSQGIQDRSTLTTGLSRPGSLVRREPGQSSQQFRLLQREIPQKTGRL